jgi:gamma-glutamylcyclotransferase (GGCT)/AIG2-like uncharacterized protein YtfP
MFRPKKIKMFLIFIYNDFRIGNKNNFYLLESRFLGVGKTIDEYTMIGIKRTNDVYVTSDEIEPQYVKSYIRGELYEVSENILAILDHFIIKDETWIRKKVPIQVHGKIYNAEMYFHNEILFSERPIRLGGKRFFPVPSGDWSLQNLVLNSRQFSWGA